MEGSLGWRRLQGHGCPRVIVADKVYTGFKPTRMVEALVACCGRVVYAGSEPEAWRAARSLGEALACRPLEYRLDGVAVPGFVDAHLHLGSLGWESRGLDLRGAESLEELLEAVRRAHRRLPSGEWLTGRGWDQERLGAWPTRYDLDEAAPGRPVLLVRVCGHAAVASSEALRRLGIDPEAPVPREKRGLIDAGCDGKPTGLLFEEEAWRAVRAAREASSPAEAVREAERILHRYGVTSAATMAATAWELRGIAEARPRLRLAVYVEESLLPLLDRLGLRAGAAVAPSAWIAGVKVFMDGSLGARTAYLEEPYSDDPHSRGRLLRDWKQLATTAAAARRLGLDVAAHAIGDAAIREALRGFEAAGCSCRIEHASLAPRSLVEWMARLNTRAAVQPLFLESDTWAEARLGSRAASLYPFRTMLLSGVLIGFSSDAPVEEPNPLKAVYAAYTRGALAHLTRSEAIDVETGLMLHTRAAALVAGIPGAGCLEEGCTPDIAVLDRDPLEEPPEALPDTRVKATIVDGEPAHGNL